MAKSSGNRVRVEQWNVADSKRRYPNGRVVVTKIAARDSKGRFHGSTNFKGSVLPES
jgi:hypothetical protein